MLRHFAPAMMVVGLIELVGCSSSDEGAPDPNARIGDIKTNDVWKDGTKLTGAIRIFEGATVTIEPGARVTCADGVVIQVGGALLVASAAKHATITCSRWRGIQVGQNGSLDIAGLDIENAETGVETTRGAGRVELTDSSILNTARPFLVGKESTVSLTRVKATTPTVLAPLETSVTEIFGKLTAKYLDYEANASEGLMLKDGGEAVIEDSTLKAKNGLDLVSSYGGTSLKLSYSTLKGAHCGPHIQGIGSFEIDHVTSEDNVYGITIYGASMEGPHLVKDSNFGGVLGWLDLQGDHGPIRFDNVFVNGPELIANTDPPTITKVPSKIDSAVPR